MISPNIVLKNGVKYIKLDKLPFPKGYWWSYSAYDAYIPLDDAVLRVLEYGDIDEIFMLHEILGIKIVNNIYHKLRRGLYRKDKYLVKILDVILGAINVLDKKNKKCY